MSPSLTRRLFVALLFWAGAGRLPARSSGSTDSTQDLNKSTSGQGLHQSISGQGLNKNISAQAKKDALPSVEKVSLADLRQILKSDSGNVIFVDAWATWCKPCQDEMPGLLKLRRAYRNKPFRLILLSGDDPGDIDSTVRPMLRKFGVDFPTYLMNETTQDAFISGMSETWSGAMPASFLYDRDGRLVETKVGERTYRQLEAPVGKLLPK